MNCISRPSSIIYIFLVYPVRNIFYSKQERSADLNACMSWDVFCIFAGLKAAAWIVTAQLAVAGCFGGCAAFSLACMLVIVWNQISGAEQAACPSHWPAAGLWRAPKDVDECHVTAEPRFCS